MQNKASRGLNRFLRPIPRDEVRFHPHSFADPSGRVFQWGDQLFRGISAEWKPFLLELFENGVIENLSRKGLFIDTQLTDYYFDQYPLVVQHRSVPFISYPQEWCPSMLKAAALAIVDLAIELAHCNLTLRDAHPWNVLFDSYKPIFVDLGSIFSTGDALTWLAYPEFSCYCLYPLILMSQGHDRIARLLISEEEGVLKRELFQLAPQYAWLHYPIWSFERMISHVYNRAPFEVQRFIKKRQRIELDPAWRHIRSQNVSAGFLEQVRKQVESISFRCFEGLGIEPVGSAQQDEEHNFTDKMGQECVRQLLAELRPFSVLDVFSHSGWYGIQAALLGSQVVAFNTNLTYVTRMYQESRDKNYSILPLIMDFTKPTPPRGLGNHWCLAAADRFKCEMVLALGLADNPALNQGLGVEQVISGLDQFTSRWLVIELSSSKGMYDEKLEGEHNSAAPLEGYLPFLEKKFHKITQIPVSSSDHVLLLCEKNQKRR